MLNEQNRKKLDEIVIKMEQNNENFDTIKFVVDDFKKKYDIPEIQKKSEKKTFEKIADISEKVLGTLSKYSGVKSAVDLGLTAGKGLAYGAERLIGKKPEEALKAVGEKPSTEIEKITAEKGLTAGIKNIAGKTIETGLIAAPFAAGAKAIQFTGQLAKQFPNIARYAGYGAQGAKYGAGFGLAKGLEENKSMKGVLSDAIKGTTTGALAGVIIPAAVEGTIRAVKNVAALYSGVSKGALENAFKNPEIVGQAVKKYAKTPESTQEILNKADESFSLIKEARGEKYAQALKEIENDIFMPKTGKNAGMVYVRNPKTNVFEPTKFTTIGVKQNLTKVLKGFNRKILSDAENSQIDELQKLVNEWDDFTPLGLEDLKKALRNRINVGNSKELNKIITLTENNLKNYINEKMPQIAKMRIQYAKDSEFIDNLQKEIFGSTSKMANSTKLNRLLNIFNQKSDLKKQLIQQLGEQTGIDLLNEITGAAMSSWLPTGWVQRFILAGSGLSGILNPAIIAAAPMASPRIVGKSARILGQLSKLTPAINKYGQPMINKILNK